MKLMKLGSLLLMLLIAVGKSTRSKYRESENR